MTRLIKYTKLSRKIRIFKVIYNFFIEKVSSLSLIYFEIQLYNNSNILNFHLYFHFSISFNLNNLRLLIAHTPIN